MLIRCFRRSNRHRQQPSSTSITRTMPKESEKDLSINQLRVSTALQALKQNKTMLGIDFIFTQA